MVCCPRPRVSKPTPTILPTFKPFVPFQPLARATAWWLLKRFQNLNIMFKAITDFSGYAGSVLITTSQTIHDAMVPIMAQFPKCPITMADFQTLIDTCNTALIKKASKAIADTNAFNVARAALEGDGLAAIGGCVNTVAKGNETVILSTGFPYYETGSSPDYSAPEAPTNLVLRQGDNSGEAVARFRPKRRNSMNEVQTCTGDPNVEANWKTIGTFSGGKATLTGIIPGTTIWVRVRTLGLKNVIGAWSETGKIMVV
jgi:hypothetical protein